MKCNVKLLQEQVLTVDMHLSNSIIKAYICKIYNSKVVLIEHQANISR